VEKLNELEGHLLELDHAFDALELLFADKATALGIVSNWRHVPPPFVNDYLVEASERALFENSPVTKEEFMMVNFTPPPDMSEERLRNTLICLQIWQNDPAVTELDTRHLYGHDNREL
jgi:hypothetical protein